MPAIRTSGVIALVAQAAALPPGVRRLKATNRGALRAEPAHATDISLHAKPGDGRIVPQGASLPVCASY